MFKSDKYELVLNGSYFYIRRLADGRFSQRLMRQDKHLQRFTEALKTGTFDLECEYDTQDCGRRTKTER